MGRTQEITRVEQEVLLEGRDDYIGLWEFVSAARNELPKADERSIRQAVLEIVSDVLERKLMRPGFPTYSGGFEALDEDPARTLVRIEREWDGLGREPDVGDIIWFDLTEKGEDYLKKLPAA